MHRELRHTHSPREKHHNRSAPSSPESPFSPRALVFRTPAPSNREWQYNKTGWENYKSFSTLAKVGIWAVGLFVFFAFFVTIYHAGLAAGQTKAALIYYDQSGVTRPQPSTTSLAIQPNTALDLREQWHTAPPHVLVLYFFKDENPEYINNFHFFLREGIVPDDGATYIIIVNGNRAKMVYCTFQQIVWPAMQMELPALPPNARYLLHTTDCDDWGTFGWVLESDDVSIADYKYFVFLTAAVRGPFLPVYVKGSIHWLSVLLSKITDQVKLVGPTINCQPTPRRDRADVRSNPHVQSYTVVTDHIGLKVLLDRGDVFKCYDNVWDSIYYSEVGSSRAILDAGYNLDSLLVRYQGVDWRRPETWGCNRNMNPLVPNFFDGSSPEAMELMFVKVKLQTLDYRVSNMEAALNFDRWYKILQKENFTADILSNVHLDKRESRLAYQIPMSLLLAKRGPKCFDCHYYVKSNVDLPRAWSRQCPTAYTHYVNNGQFELREARYTCEFDPASILPVHINMSDPVHRVHNADEDD